ncbi:MAG: N-acetylmuramoyl-L-alanine amidase [Bacillota bacterium]
MRRIRFWTFSLRNYRLRLLLIAFMSAFMVYMADNLAGQDAEVMSWVVANKIIVVDPGHGGEDPGAVGPGGTLEKNITLAISQYLAENLSQAGAAVLLTRATDTDLVTPGEGTRKKRDLDNRVSIARRNNADLYISIQANSFGKIWTGAQTFYHAKHKDNRQLAMTIQDALKRVMRNTEREAKSMSSEAYILKQLEMPAALVEVGFISNPAEEKMLNDPMYQQKLAFAIYTGIVQFYSEPPSN